jgi:hypothetical protein
MQTLRCATEMKLVGNGDEITQLPEFHTLSLGWIAQLAVYKPLRAGFPGGLALEPTAAEDMQQRRPGFGRWTGPPKA